MNEPKLSEAIEYIASLGACEPALRWLREFASNNPEASCSMVWSEVLALHKLHPDDKPPKDTHVGKSWLAWFARHVVHMPCSNGTFSGMPKVNDGPSVEKLDCTEALVRLAVLVRGD